MRFKMQVRIVLCFMLLILLPGCSGSGGSGTDEAEDDPEAEAAEFMAVIEELLSEQVSP